MSTMRYGIVYGLYDPRDGALRYIGQTTQSLDVRLRGHLNPANLAKRYHSARWLASLRALGLRPETRLLQEASTQEELDVREVKWISQVRADGARLTNHTDGGGGQRGRIVSDETRAKMSAAKKGRVGTRTGTKQSAEARAKVSASLRGKLGEASRPFRHDMPTSEILRFVAEGLSQEQIAQHFDTARGTIAKRITAARRDGIIVHRPRRQSPQMAARLRGVTGQSARAYRHDVSVETVVGMLREGLSQREIARRLSVCRQLVGSRVNEAKQLKSWGS